MPGGGRPHHAPRGPARRLAAHHRVPEWQRLLRRVPQPQLRHRLPGARAPRRLRLPRMDVGDHLPDAGVRVAALHAVAARQASRARRGRRPLQPVHAPRHDGFRRAVGQDPGAAPGDVPVGGDLHGAHHRRRRQHEDAVRHRVRRGVPGAAAHHRGVVPRLHLRGRAAVPAPQPQLHRRCVAGGRHRRRRLLHHDLGRVRRQGAGARRVLRPRQGPQRRRRRTGHREWARNHRLRFQGAQCCTGDSGHHAVDSETSFSCAHVEGRQGSLRHRCALLLPPRHRWLLGLWKPDPSERHPERPVQVPQPRRVPAGAGHHHAAGDHQLPDHVPDLRHARVRQHGGRVRAQEEPAVPPVAALGLPCLLRRHQPPHRRRAAVPVGARRPPGGDLAAGHAGVPVLHVGGDQETAEGHGDVERQLGSGDPRDEHKLRARSREPVGSRGERLAREVLQACGFPVSACKIVKHSGSRFVMKYDVWCCVP